MLHICQSKMIVSAQFYIAALQWFGVHKKYSLQYKGISEILRLEHSHKRVTCRYCNTLEDYPGTISQALDKSF